MTELSRKTCCFAHDDEGSLCDGELIRHEPPERLVGVSSYLIVRYICNFCKSEKHVSLMDGYVYYHNKRTGKTWNLVD